MQPSPLTRYLLIAYTLLVVYGSLHPFSGWRNHGIEPFAYLFAPAPRYVTAFDLAANVAAYFPLGFLGVLALFPVLRGAAGVTAAAIAGVLLSVTLETLQNYLPSRIASNLDVSANAFGALAGAMVATRIAYRLMRDAGLHALRYRVFRPGGHVDLGLVLIALWWVSQLNPETLLFGAGDLRELLRGPTATLHEPAVFMRVEAGVAAANTLAVGLLAAALLNRGQSPQLMVIGLLTGALLVRTLAFGTLFSPPDMFAWVTPGAAYGVGIGVLLVVIACALPRTATLVLSALALMAATALVNLAPGNPYTAAALAVWRQGHFFNFNGLTRIVSAVWPFCALVYLMLLAGERRRLE